MYGLVVADESEFAAVYNFGINQKKVSEGVTFGNRYIEFELPCGCELKVVFCGIGKVNASSATSFLISEGAQAIFNIGLSGSLLEGNINAVVIGTRYFEADFDLTPLGYSEFSKPFQDYVYDIDPFMLQCAVQALPNAILAPVCCGDYFLNDSIRGAYLHKKYGVAAFDMESGAVASVCYKTKIPFLALRQISDNADENAAEVYKDNNNQCKLDLIKSLSLCIAEYFTAEN